MAIPSTPTTPSTPPCRPSLPLSAAYSDDPLPDFTSRRTWTPGWVPFKRRKCRWRRRSNDTTVCTLHAALVRVLGRANLDQLIAALLRSGYGNT